MKATKIMLAVMTVFILTWLGVGLVVYLLSESITYREALNTPGVLLAMIIFGWIPSVIVGVDLDDVL